MQPERLGEELGDHDRLLLVFGYLGPLALVSLTVSRREFVKWHAKQGLVLWSSLVISYPVLHFLRFLFDRYLWAVFGQIFTAGIWLTVTGVALAALAAVIRALEGERFKLPVLGDLTDRL